MSGTLHLRLLGNGKWVAWRALGGAAAGAVFFLAFVAYRETVQPSTRLPGGHSAALSEQPPFVDGDWIKIPFDRERDRACLTQSTISVVRETDYPPPLGRREDDVTVAIRNNPVSGVGRHPKLLWVRRPDVPPGDWTVAIDVGRDCGSWIHPGTAESGPIPLGVVRLPEP